MMILSDIMFKNSSDPSDSKNKLDLYVPDNVISGPLLVYVHGGAWRTGDKSDFKFIAERFMQKGFAIAIVNYRLSNVSKYPAPMLDVKLHSLSIGCRCDYLFKFNLYQIIIELFSSFLPHWTLCWSSDSGSYCFKGNWN